MTAINMTVIAYICLGSNVGDSASLIRKALDMLDREVRVAKVSSLYRTEPVGFREQDDFLNAVAEVETGRSPDELLALCRSVEEQLGRVRTERWGPRTMDLDILLYGGLVIETETLVIPHPRMAERRFVLEPLAEIAPGVVHPRLGRTAVELLASLRDGQGVTRLGSVDRKK